jgi:hypothetical protein
MCELLYQSMQGLHNSLPLRPSRWTVLGTGLEEYHSISHLRSISETMDRS